VGLRSYILAAPHPGNCGASATTGHAPALPGPAMKSRRLQAWAFEWIVSKRLAAPPDRGRRGTRTRTARRCGGRRSVVFIEAGHDPHQSPPGPYVPRWPLLLTTSQCAGQGTREADRAAKGRLRLGDRCALSDGVGVCRTARTLGCGAGTVQRIKAGIVGAAAP